MERKLVIKLESYWGEETGLSIEMSDRPEQDTMWIIVTLDENGQPINDLTDYGYRTEEEARRAAKL